LPVAGGQAPRGSSLSNCFNDAQIGLIIVSIHQFPDGAAISASSNFTQKYGGIQFSVDKPPARVPSIKSQSIDNQNIDNQIIY
jgi:hypothetical protein